MPVQLLAENPSLDAGAQGDLRLLARKLDMEARRIDDILDVTRTFHGKTSAVSHCLGSPRHELRAYWTEQWNQALRDLAVTVHANAQVGHRFTI